MRSLRIISILLMVALSACTSNNSSPANTPVTSWNNSNQIGISVSTGDILAVVGEQVLITPSVVNAQPSSFSISPALPIGISLDIKTGIVSGVAAVVQPRTIYSLNVIDTLGRSAKTSIYIQTNPDLAISYPVACEIPWKDANGEFSQIALLSNGQAWCQSSHTLFFNTANNNCYVDGTNLLFTNSSLTACAVPSANQVPSGSGTFNGTWITFVDPEVTSVSGSSVDLNQFITGGKGDYIFVIVDPSYGSVTSSGIFTPGTKTGDVQFLVTDNIGLGSQASFTIHVGVPALTVNYANPTEGSPLIMQLNLSGKSAVSSTINYSISLLDGNGNQTAMNDNVSQVPGSVTIAAGSTTAQIIIPTFNNHINKINGIFTVTLTLDQKIRFQGSDASSNVFSVVVINVNPPPLVSFSLASSTVVEYDQFMSLTVNLIGLDGLPLASTKTVAVDYILDPNFSTVKNFDDNFINGTQVFAPGQISAIINFQLYHDVNGNQVASPDRLMSFELQNPVNATLGPIVRYNMTIIDPMVVDIANSVTDFVLLNQLQLQGWNTTQNVLVRIEPTGIVKSSTPVHAAFSSGFIQPVYPTTITMVNNGTIIGHGGTSGAASNPNSTSFVGYCNQQIPGLNGGVGGAAISVVSPMTLTNSGQILAGGGGGGGGVSAVIGNDGLCTLSKDRITGGSGGIGADTGTGSPLLAGPGSLAQSVPVLEAAFVSAGGSGGLPGLPGSPGVLPAVIGAGAQPGLGGLSGTAIMDLDKNSNHLISIQNTTACQIPWADGTGAFATIPLQSTQGQTWCQSSHALSFNDINNGCYVDGTNILYANSSQAVCIIPAVNQIPAGSNTFNGVWATLGIVQGQ